MRQPTHEEFDVVKHLARASQNATTKAQLAAVTLEDKLNELREACDAPGNATITMAAGGQILWTDREGKPFGQPEAKPAVGNDRLRENNGRVREKRT